MKKTALLFACAALVIGGMSVAAPETASAADFGRSYGSRWSGTPRYQSGSWNRGYQSRGYDRGDWGQNNFGYGNSGYGSSGYGNGWSNRSARQGHFDYHAPSNTPHGNHDHVQPGHSDYHRGGHGGNY